MKVKLLKKIRKESEMHYSIIKMPDGTYKVTYKYFTYDFGLNKEQAIESYKQYVYNTMESKIKEMRYHKYKMRRIQFSIWK